MELSLQPSPAPKANGPQPVTDFLVANRKPVAVVLLLLALAAFAGGATLIARTFRPADTKAADVPSEFAPANPDDLLRVGTPEYLLGGVGALTLAGVLGTAGWSASRRCRSRRPASATPTPAGRSSSSAASPA